MYQRSFFAVAALCVMALGSLVSLSSVLLGQGVLISERPFPLPRPHVPAPPEANYKITHLSIEGRVADQVAEIQVSQTFHNCGHRVLEAQFVFPLPTDGAIDQLTLMVDGKELPGKLLSKDEARRRYEAIVRANRDPALLEWIGGGMFQTSVFPIPAGQTRTVTLHYHQLLKKDHQLTAFTFPLSTAKYSSQPLEELSIKLSISSEATLKNIYSPSHGVQVQRQGKKRVLISHVEHNTIPTSDFRLYFDAEEGAVTASLLSSWDDAKEDGYFLLLASPEIKAHDAQRPAKTVLFVVDKSGSMSGKKIEQAREALKFVLNNLRDGDLFNIVAYDSKVETFRPELERFNKESREEALGYVEGLFAGGGTNIHAALSQGLGMLKDEDRPTYVLFLTDGMPTNGVTNEAEIAAVAKQMNTVRARIMAFGVGHDVNSRLLDRLSRDGFGLSEYVTPEEDIEEHVARVYSRISAPVLSQVRISIERDADDQNPIVNRLYPGGTFDLFEGEQLVLVGRYRKSGDVQIRLTGKVGDQEQNHTFQGELADREHGQSHAFVAKLWATRRIGELIDELDLQGHNQELVDELITLSTKHGILTPYTAFLADETVTPSLAAGGAAIQNNTAATRRNLEALEQPDGADAFRQRASKQEYKQSDRASSLQSYALPAAPGLGGSGGAQALGTALHPVADNVRNSGSQTLYKRGKLVVTPETADLNPEQDKAQIQVVERYTPEYFAIVTKNTEAENGLLSQQQEHEELLVKLRGQVYLFK